MKKFKLFMLYFVLSVFALIVLLPLFWMIITAFKQPGRGLEISFLPNTEVVTPAFPINKNFKAGTNYVTFEYQSLTAEKISVSGSFQGWKPDVLLLDKYGDLWRKTIEIKPGKYQFKYVINGEYEKGKNRSLNIQKGRNTAGQLLNNTYIKKNTLYIQYKKPEIDKMTVLFNTGKILELKKDDNGYFTGNINLTDDLTKYNFKYNRSFVEAFADMYTLDNFYSVLYNKDFPFGQFFWNSVVVSFLSGFFTVVICTMGGYAFAKKKFFMKEKLFLLLLGSMLIPGMIFMVPQFALVSKFGWLNSYKAMVIPHLANVFGIFLLRQYIKTIPNSLFEAATIDGASELQIFRIIVIPLSLPIIITLFLLAFLGQWANFLWQLIVNTPDSLYRTLPVGLALFKGQYGTFWTKIMAGACFSIVPIAILFLFAQKFFIEGMTGGSVKE